MDKKVPSCGKRSRVPESLERRLSYTASNLLRWSGHAVAASREGHRPLTTIDDMRVLRSQMVAFDRHLKGIEAYLKPSEQQPKSESRLLFAAAARATARTFTTWMFRSPARDDERPHAGIRFVELLRRQARIARRYLDLRGGDVDALSVHRIQDDVLCMSRPRCQQQQKADNGGFVRPHADARLRGDTRGRDGSIR